MQTLPSAGIGLYNTHRISVTGNLWGRSDFFPQVRGKIRDVVPGVAWQETSDGDGIASHRKSRLPGISQDIVSLDSDDATSPLPLGQ